MKFERKPLIFEKAIPRGLDRCAREGGFVRAGKGCLFLVCVVMIGKLCLRKRRVSDSQRFDTGPKYARNEENSTNTLS